MRGDMKSLQRIDWEKLERAVRLRIRVLAVTAKQLDSPLADIAAGMIFKSLNVLASFVDAIELGDEDAIAADLLPDDGSPPKIPAPVKIDYLRYSRGKDDKP